MTFYNNQILFTSQILAFTVLSGILQVVSGLSCIIQKPTPPPNERATLLPIPDMWNFTVMECGGGGKCARQIVQRTGAVKKYAAFYCTSTPLEAGGRYFDTDTCRAFLYDPTNFRRDISQDDFITYDCTECSGNMCNALTKDDPLNNGFIANNVFGGKFPLPVVTAPPPTRTASSTVTTTVPVTNATTELPVHDSVIIPYNGTGFIKMTYHRMPG